MCLTVLHIRPRLTVEFGDWSGNITVDSYGDDAEQLFPCTIPEIQEQEEKVKLTI